jgi:cell wall-associated NlpC family hydrolase
MALTTSPCILAAPHPLPNVSPKMEKPEFWIKKIKNPKRLLLTPEAIQRINEASLRNQDLYLWNVKDLKEEWTEEEILSFLREDWEGFGRIDEGRYDKHRNPLKEPFWTELKKDLNEQSLKEKNQLSFGLIVKRTDIRYFPTQELSTASPANNGFDQIQHSTVPPGSLVGVFHFSKNKLWAYVQTRFVRGWVQAKDLAIANEKKEAIGYDEAKERLVITGDFINVYHDPAHQQIAFTTQMGVSFPLLDLPGQTKVAKNDYIIRIPFRENDGQLTFRKGYIPMGKDVHSGFLPYTQENLARQAFKMLHQPYGWGEMYGARDCSRLVMDLFSTFGIIMPRNSKFQARIGIDLDQAGNMTSKEKEKILDQAVPLATILRLPGHIMLYLGKDRGRYYVIHNIWGIQKAGESGPVLHKIGRVVVSDLSLGSSGPNGSLLDRITDIQVIGQESKP